MLSERLKDETKKLSGSSATAFQQNFCQTESATTLARKGNESKTKHDPHTCCICLKTLTSRSSLKNHIENFHCKTEEMSCDLCAKTFFTKASVFCHMNSVHGSKKFACKKCDYKATTKDHFNRHKLVHAKKVKCPICKLYVSEVKAHMRVHRPKERCPICNQMLTTEYMKHHLKTHERKPCKNCNLTFETHKALQK